MSCVIYIRVSSKKQQASGLSIQAQREQCEEFAIKNGLKIEGIFIETASGSDDDRPKLQEAMALCASKDAHLCVAKLSRISRRLSFVAKLLDENISFFVVEWGFRKISTFECQIYGAFAELERTRISTRVKEALRVAKANGVKLGNPKISEARILGNARRSALADEFAARTLTVIHDIQATGVSTLTDIADCLNRRGYTTRRGNQFSATTVRRVIIRNPLQAEYSNV